MTINFTSAGKDLALKNIVGRSFSSNMYVKLYVNNFSITSNTVTSDLIECTAANYSRIQLLQANWTFSNNTASYPKIKFHIDESIIIYGYFVVQNNVLLYAEPFPEPISLDSDGGEIFIDINISM